MEIINSSVQAKAGSREIKGHLIVQVAMGMDILEELCDPSNGGGFIHELQITPFKVTPQPWGVWNGESQLRLVFKGERRARGEDLSGKVKEVLDVLRRWEGYYIEDYPEWEWEFKVE